MSVIKICISESDDRQFVDAITNVIAATLNNHRPDDVQIFRIDNWFGHHWLGFSGKVLGALGIRANRLTMPPFVANRITDQFGFQLDPKTDSYASVLPDRALHFAGPSAENLRRTIAKIAPNTGLFWYSGTTLTTNHGSLMGYIPTADETEMWTWYLSFVRKGDWVVTRRINIPPYEMTYSNQIEAFAHEEK